MALAHCKGFGEAEDSSLSLSLVIVCKWWIFLVLGKSHFKEHNSHLWITWRLTKAGGHCSPSPASHPPYLHPMVMVVLSQCLHSLVEILACKSWRLFSTRCFELTTAIYTNKPSPKLWLHKPAQKVPKTNGPMRSHIPISAAGTRQRSSSSPSPNNSINKLPH